jgi:hypothetical protein
LITAVGRKNINIIASINNMFPNISKGYVRGLRKSGDTTEFSKNVEKPTHIMYSILVLASSSTERNRAKGRMTATY